jgi:hypothetical protein
MPGKTNGRRNRIAGQNFEREGVKAFSLFYPHVATSRNVSRVRDAEKVDLAHTDEIAYGRFPYNLQYKNYSRPIAYQKLLSELPRINGIINAIIHKSTSKVGDRFIKQGEYAILPLEDFMKMVAWRRGYEMLREAHNEGWTYEAIEQELKTINL